MESCEYQIFWIIGSNAVGKTTLAKLIHQYFLELSATSNYPSLIEYHSPEYYCVTKMSEFSCNLGDMTTENQCNGTDTLNTKSKIQLSFKAALNHAPVVVVEGIMATGTWIEFMKKPGVNVCLILLDMQLEDNLERVRLRRAKKRGKESGDIEITENTRENLEAKLRSFRSLYKRMSPLVDYHFTLSGKVNLKVMDKIIRKMIEKSFV